MPNAAGSVGVAPEGCTRGLRQSIHATASSRAWRLCGKALAAHGHRLSRPQQRWVAGMDRSRVRQGMPRLPNAAVVPCSASAAAKVRAGVLAAPRSLCPSASPCSLNRGAEVMFCAPNAHFRWVPTALVGAQIGQSTIESIAASAYRASAKVRFDLFFNCRKQGAAAGLGSRCTPLKTPRPNVWRWCLQCQCQDRAQRA